MHHSIYQWAGFAGIVTAMLAIDLGVANKKAHAVSLKEAAIWSCVWIATAIGFGAYVYQTMGSAVGDQYTTGYILEKSLSVDNLTVFYLIFSYFGIPEQYRHRVLYWGVLGAIVMRVVLIFCGTAAISWFHELVFFFGLFLMYTSVKLFTAGDDEDPEPDKNPVVRFLSKRFAFTETLHEEKFFVRLPEAESGKLALYATPLVITLISVEVFDLMFAADSIPSILGVSQDPFVLITSNIFAILGLRSLYFVLDALIPLLSYLQQGVAIVLFFVGTKLIAGEFIEIPTKASLLVVAGILAISVIISLLFPKKEEDGEGAIEDTEALELEAIPLVPVEVLAEDGSVMMEIPPSEIEASGDINS